MTYYSALGLGVETSSIISFISLEICFHLYRTENGNDNSSLDTVLIVKLKTSTGIFSLTKTYLLMSKLLNNIS
jgi:hypothetical protein